MLEDIVGDYKEKTVTLEDFPFFDSTVKMASVHPCKHASVMKVLLDRADAALKIRKARMKTGTAGLGGREKVASGMEGLVDSTSRMHLEGKKSAFASGVVAAGGNGGDEWEVLQHEGGVEDDEVAIRVDQYLVVFLVSFSLWNWVKWQCSCGVELTIDSVEIHGVRYPWH